MNIHCPRLPKRLFQGLAGSPLAHIDSDMLTVSAPIDRTAELAVEILTAKHKRGRPPKHATGPMTESERKFLSRQKQKWELLEKQQLAEQKADRQSFPQPMFMPDAPQSKGKLVTGGDANDMQNLDLSARRVDHQYDPENSVPGKSTVVPISPDADLNEMKESDRTFISRQNFSANRKRTYEEKKQIVLSELENTAIFSCKIPGRESQGEQFGCEICNTLTGPFRRDAIKHVSRHQALIDARIKELFPSKSRRNAGRNGIGKVEDTSIEVLVIK